jgi:putative addiction module component (TIGR02574 family)
VEPNKSWVDAELYQEGCTRVQYFSSPAVPVLPDTPLEPRRGRPSRSGTEHQQAVEQIKSQISALSTAERADLAYFLLASLKPEEEEVAEAEQLRLTEAQKQDLARRLAEVRDGKAG